MTTFCGTVWGQLETSHIYAVFKGPYIYIGETSNVPPARWGSHLVSKTDFMAKLIKVDPVVARDNSPVFFVGIHLNVADNEPKVNRPFARKAIEAELHQLFELDTSRVSPATTVLSSACSPARHRFGFDKRAVAKEIYELIGKKYQRWRQKVANMGKYSVVDAIIPADVLSATSGPSNYGFTELGAVIKRMKTSE